MNAPLPPFKIALREGDRVLLDDCAARVTFVTPDCVLLDWEEPLPSQSPQADACHSGREGSAHAHPLSPWLADGATQLTHLEVHEAWKSGHLVVLDQRHERTPGRRTVEQVLASCTARGAESLRWRLGYVEIMLDLIRRGRLKATRASIAEQLDVIEELYGVRLLKAASKARRRAGRKKHAAAKTGVEVPTNPPSAKTLRGYLAKYEAHGVSGLLDNYHRSGNRASRFDAETTVALRRFVRDALRQEDTSIEIVKERVWDRFGYENEERAKACPPLTALRIPAVEAIRSELARVSPLIYALKTRSKQTAERSMQPVGQGPKADRALQSVFCDDWMVDIKVLFEEANVWKGLAPEEKQMFFFDGKPRRLWVSAAIDLATHTVVGLQFALDPSTDLFLRLIEMILLDKSDWANGSGSLCRWPMQGIPESLIVDRGSSFDSLRAYAAMAALGIDQLGCPAGDPHLKGMVERLFRTAHERLIARFAGRTHSNPFKRPDYDDDAMARLTPDLLIRGFLRFLVDIHHTTPLKALGGRTPLQAWEGQMRDGFGVNPPPDLPTMRRVFGTPLTRTLTRSGLCVLKVQYHSDDLALRFMRYQQRDYEIRWWPHDIGCIEVRVGAEEWMSVPAVEEGFAGKSFEAMRASLGLGSRDPDMEHIQSQARRYIDGLDPSAATIRQTFESTYTPERVEKLEQVLLRHFTTAERKDREGSARGLFADVVAPWTGTGSDIGPTPASPDAVPVSPPASNPDFME